jgi:hypothetical protein
MKTYILSIGIALLAISFTAVTSSFTVKDGVSCCKDADCCKNCDDAECKATCVKVSDMSAKELHSKDGKALAAKCKILCEKNGCCDKAKACSKKGKDGKKSCCKH